MKENKVKTFEAYQKEISEIKQSNANSKKELHDEHDLGPLKSLSKKNLENKKTSAKPKKKSLQKSQNAIIKPVSPNRHKNCNNHSPVKNVSYGQLQLILQNIDSIKQKAKLQIQDLQTKNKLLENDLNLTRKKYENVRIVEQQLQIQRNQLNQAYDTMKAQFDKKRIQIDLKQRIWIEEKQQYLQEIINFKEMIRLEKLEKNQIQTKLNHEVSLKRQWSSRYESLVQTITQNKPERLQELVYQITQTYQNQSALDIINSFEKEIIVFKKQKQQLQITLQSIQENLQTQKRRNIKSEQLISGLMQENRSLLEKISLKQIEYKEELNKLTQTLNSQKSLNTTSKQELKNLQLQHGYNVKQNEQLKQNIIKLEDTIKNLQIQANNINDSLQKQKLNRKYFDIVEDQCDEYEDLSKMLNKIQMFQKCKIQNRTNIEKIQFLCKMLDY